VTGVEFHIVQRTEKELDALRKRVRLLLVSVLLMKEELLNDFLVVTFTFNLTANTTNTAVHEAHCPVFAIR
jgi:hypothetical protein